MSTSAGFRPTFHTRAAGVLMHVTSLPGPFGSGDLSQHAYRFVDFLQRAGQTWWQMLPVNPPGEPPANSSPYDSSSSIAGSPYLVSLEGLCMGGLLKRDELARPRGLRHDRVEFALVRHYRELHLRMAHRRFRARRGAMREAYEQFRAEHADWLEDFALFSVLRAKHDNRPWWEWETGARLRRKEAMAEARRDLLEDVDFHRFVQFVFDRQWSALRKHAHARRVGLIGDIPIFVGHNSADVWSHRHLFLLDKDGRPKAVSGYPPDEFGPEGQRWGHPQYNWAAHAKEGYRWWTQRFAHTMRLFDGARIDHFVGFSRLWSIPAAAGHSKEGRWVKAPGRAVLGAVREAMGEVPMIAEDLGQPTPGIPELLKEFGIPGMRILQFGYAAGQDNNAHRPHAYPRDTVVYTGTHDNDTIVGWFRSLDGATKRRVLAYSGGEARDLHRSLIRVAYTSVADTAIIPVQDLLGLGSAHRMNTPGTVGINWHWRLPPNALTGQLARELRTMSELSGRVPA